MLTILNKKASTKLSFKHTNFSILENSIKFLRHIYKIISKIDFQEFSHANDTNIFQIKLPIFSIFYKNHRTFGKVRKKALHHRIQIAQAMTSHNKRAQQVFHPVHYNPIKLHNKKRVKLALKYPHW